MKMIDVIKVIERTPCYWEEVSRLEFACLLYKAMEEQGKSEEELSESSGVSRRHISEVLGGNASGLKLSTMSRLMYELGEKINFSVQPINSCENSAPEY